MPDIALCTNETCPLKDNCYRYTAIPDEYRQSYCKFAPVINEVLDEVECKHFIDNNKKEV